MFNKLTEMSIIAKVALFGVVFLCCGSVTLGSALSEDDADLVGVGPVDQSGLISVDTPEPGAVVDENVEQVLNIADYNKETLSSIEAVLGTPDRNNDVRLPSFSSAVWETEQYKVYVEYKKDEDIVYGGFLYLKSVACEGNAITEVQLENVLTAVDLAHVESDWTFRNGYYLSEKTAGWDSIRVSCDQDNGYVYINALASGYMEWASN